MVSQPTILVVEDERELADLYATWVGDHYEVLTAYDGTSALEQVSDAVDVVLLDRRMPDLTGDEVVREIRRRGHDCWVIMVTAVDPGLDILALEIDDYVTKPVTRSQLSRIIETLRVQSRYNGRRKLTSLSNKVETLEEERSVSFDEIENSDAYRRLEDELAELSASFGDDGDDAGEADGLES